MTIPVRLRSALVCCLLAAGCAWNPVKKRPEVVLVSRAQEKELGDAEAKRVAEAMGLHDAPALDAYLSTVGQRLVEHAPGHDTYVFHVVDMEEPNAFALPGGHVYVSRGLLAIMNSEDELAGVLGHEIGRPPRGGTDHARGAVRGGDGTGGRDHGNREPHPRRCGGRHRGARSRARARSVQPGAGARGRPRRAGSRRRGRLGPERAHALARDPRARAGAPRRAGAADGLLLDPSSASEPRGGDGGVRAEAHPRGWSPHRRVAGGVRPQAGGSPGRSAPARWRRRGRALLASRLRLHAPLPRGLEGPECARGGRGGRARP